MAFASSTNLAAVGPSTRARYKIVIYGEDPLAITG